jgi:hypothetical protein
MEDHIHALQLLVAQTPQNDEAFDQSTLAAVTKLCLVKPAAKTTAEAAEARAEAFMAALDDVPHWAVIASIRKWYRGECGKDDRGEPYNYTWAPEPHDLRKLALSETFALHARIAEIQKVMGAVAYVDCSVELANGRAAMRGLFKSMQKNDAAVLASLTFEQAAKIGEEGDAEQPGNQEAA